VIAEVTSSKVLHGEIEVISILEAEMWIDDEGIIKVIE
jgi:hypothetical protein